MKSSLIIAHSDLDWILLIGYPNTPLLGDIRIDSRSKINCHEANICPECYYLTCITVDYIRWLLAIISYILIDYTHRWPFPRV